MSEERGEGEKGSNEVNERFTGDGREEGKEELGRERPKDEEVIERRGTTREMDVQK